MEIREYCLPALLIAFLQFSGCSKEAPREASKIDQTATVTADKTSAASITIASVTPDPSQPLTQGASVKLKVSADYVLPSNGGSIGMVIQSADTKLIGSSLKDVSGGTGKFNGEIDFVVPNSKNIVLHMPLYVKGESKSAHVATKQYQVAAAK